MRLRKDHKVELIKRVPLFAECSNKELSEVAGIADEIDLREGKELTKQGKPGREFFVLVDGTAEVKRGTRRVNLLGPGDFFGEISLVRQVPRTATVVATEPVEAWAIDGPTFLAAVTGHDLSSAEAEALIDERLRGDTAGS